MRSRFEDQPWYSEWKKTTDRVIAALMARDSTKQGTPEREAADREYEAAIENFGWGDAIGLAQLVELRRRNAEVHCGFGP